MKTPSLAQRPSLLPRHLQHLLHLQRLDLREALVQELVRRLQVKCAVLKPKAKGAGIRLKCGLGEELIEGHLTREFGTLAGLQLLHAVVRDGELGACERLAC